MGGLRGGPGQKAEAPQGAAMCCFVFTLSSILFSSVLSQCQGSPGCPSRSEVITKQVMFKGKVLNTAFFFFFFW